jgi:hypothetical protein
MPNYLFKCPACDQLVARERSRKYAYIRDECNAGTKGRQQVRMKYVSTLPKHSRESDVLNDNQLDD